MNIPTDPNATSTWREVASIIIGGAGVKAIDIFFEKRKKRHTALEATDVAEVEDGSKFRKELWDEINTLREKIDSLQKELDDWKTKYFSLLIENNRLLQQYHEDLINSKEHPTQG